MRGLKKSDVDNFVDDVFVNNKPWSSGVQEPLTGPHVFVCVLMSRNEWNRDSAHVLIDKFKEEVELRGSTDQVFVTTCSHTEGHKYAGRLWIYIPDSYGSLTCHWYRSVHPDDVPELLDKHIGKGEVIERHWSPGLRKIYQRDWYTKWYTCYHDESIAGYWYRYMFHGFVPELLDQHIEKGEIIERNWRGQIGAYSDEAEEINDRELPNGEENKKVEEPQETTKACARTDALGKLSSLIRNWEQSDVLTATVVVGAVAAVVVAYSFL